MQCVDPVNHACGGPLYHAVWWQVKSQSHRVVRFMDRTIGCDWAKVRPKAPVTPGLRPGYDLPATEKCWNREQIVERTYD